MPVCSAAVGVTLTPYLTEVALRRLRAEEMPRRRAGLYGFQSPCDEEAWAYVSAMSSARRSAPSTRGLSWVPSILHDPR